MPFDPTEFDADFLDDQTNDEAIWFSNEGPKTIQGYLTIGSDFEDESGTSIRVDDEIRFYAPDAQMKGLKRKGRLKIRDRQYEVLGFEPDGSGWTYILLDKV